MVAFHATLSERSVYMRYFAGISYQQRTAHDRLTRVCAIDYEVEMALVAEMIEDGDRQGDLVGVGRLVRNLKTNTGEFALVISDNFQRRGLGAELLQQLIQVGRDEKLDAIEGWIAPLNHGMQSLSRKLGFTVSFSRDEELAYAILPLDYSQNGGSS